MSPRATPMAPDERRRAIVDAVVPLLVEHGSGVSTRQIAQAAGIAEGTIYRAFPTKVDLWRAAAEQTMQPDVERGGLAAVTEGVSDLRTIIVRVADHLLQRSQRVMAVMVALRHALADGSRENGAAPDRPPGKNHFVEANKALMEGLAEIFESHRDELTVEPEMAAMVLRSLVLGQRHPGAHADYLLTPDEVADVMLDGVRRRKGE